MQKNDFLQILAFRPQHYLNTFFWIKKDLGNAARTQESRITSFINLVHCAKSMFKLLITDNQYFINLTPEKLSHLACQTPSLFHCQNHKLLILRERNFLNKL
jgi:hypothetical protein